MKKLLAANRGEIAIRILRAASELGLRTSTIYSEEDRLSLHRFKADESYLVGQGKGPVAAYLDIEGIVATAKENGVDLIHPGYGFLSENPDFARACAAAGITFVGPAPRLLELLGDKVAARKLAQQAGVPIVPGTDGPVEDPAAALEAAKQIGLPVIIKAAFGGGGRGMRVVTNADELEAKIEEAQKEAKLAFGNGSVFIERFVGRARHIEVQILADSHGEVMHLFERDCSVQRRHQKVVEIAPAPNLPAAVRDGLCEAAVKLARTAGYVNAGTVEFLVDADTHDWFFIEVNPRVQVEHTVTEMVTGVDIVRSQILVAQGAKLHEAPLNLPPQDQIQVRGFAIQCRITTEDPEDNFAPDYGRIQTYRSPAGFGIRLDGATAYAGAQLVPYYDSLLVKLTGWDSTLAGASLRVDRALREFRIRGVKTNIPFLENVVLHPSFQAGKTTTGFLTEHPELFQFTRRRDRANRLLRYIGDVIVNDNATVSGKPRPQTFEEPFLPEVQHGVEPPAGTRTKLLELGPKAFAEWVKQQPQLLFTDTTFRDAHQSLLATRVRSHDLMKTAEFVAQRLPQLFSLEMWGGATFDVAMRFLYEDPWQRLREMREKVPNICFQMLLRASNAVGYTSYPDNVVREFTLEAARQGVDVFRIFDSLNDVDNMEVAVAAALEAETVLCEPAICYTGDLFDPARPKYRLDYYIKLAKRMESMGAHILAIKDMAGLCRPYAGFELVRALKQEVGLPIHFHTHDSSGLNAATLLKAAEAGVDIVDGAVSTMSGSTSQPNLNSMVASLAHTERDPGLDQDALSDCARYWETVRTYYLPFDNAPRHGSADIYRHEIPGGQFTNLQQQANAMGLGHRWPEVETMYAEVNQLFGDIVKVTPSSKVVGDMALFLLAKGMTCDEVRALPADHGVAFPDSVRDMFAGSLGAPPDGWPAEVQKILLRGEKPRPGRWGATLPPADFEAIAKELQQKIEREPTHDEVLSYVLYPQVFLDYAGKRRDFADVSVLTTPVFFYGMEPGEETVVEIEPGKSLIIKFLAVGDPHEDGTRVVFYELNGQPRQVSVRDRSLKVEDKARRKARANEHGEVGAPTPGLITGLFVELGAQVKKNEKLLSLEAMKMQSTIYAPIAGKVTEILVKPGDQVEAKDLLAVIE
ncbi:MAG: pyruvate carboxylase [Acidobacteria bacterium]|nr:pyruvate carboxylase [Acidobacteriota bacterium]